MSKPTILLVDDSPDQLTLLTAQLERTGAFATEGFSDARDAIRRVQADPPDGVVCDLRMPVVDGLELTRTLRAAYPSLPVIIVTASGSAEDAEACLAAGAADFVTKPVDPATLTARIRKALAQAPAAELLEAAARERFDPHGIIGTHPLVRGVRAFVDQVAAVHNVSVLILGASGTGKNLVARAIHAASDASRLRFVEVNCAALPEQLLESELFGHERGAFTDARQAKRGLVEEADGGTLFLDEIGSMPPELQAKLLTFLESRSFRRIGGTQDRSVDLRVVAATNADLPRMVRDGAFREDLYYRLNVASHVLPPLRQIRSDIGALARHFTKRAAAYFRRAEPTVPTEAVEVLEGHDWPGNARELRNVVERALIFSDGTRLTVRPEMLGVHDGLLPGVEPAPSPGSELGKPPGGAPPSPSPDHLVIPVGLSMDEVERRYIRRTLADHDGHVGKTAAQLGMTRKVFWARRKRLGLL